MKRLSYFIIVFAVLGIALSGCSRQGDPTLPDYHTGDNLSALLAPLALIAGASPAVTTSSVINGYLVHFDGRMYDSGQTTFSYTVSGTGAAHALSNFFLELPDCAPALDSFEPTGATINVNPLSGIYGVKWDQLLGTNGTRSYSITFPGDITLGVIRTSVKASTLLEIGEIAGPCDGFEISGTVFVDTDGNGIMTEADELGIIVDVTVTLVDSDGNIQTALTDINGEYAFLKIPGTYTVRIDTATTADDFNEELAASFDPTGPTSKIVTVGPNAIGNDFGFDPRTEEITYDIEMGILLTTGEPVKFWKKQLRASISGGKGNTEFDAATMGQFIIEIQELFFPDPFQFTPGNEFQEALEILSIKSKDPYEQLLRELLAAEFNEVSGKGLVDAPELQSVMLSWAESVAIVASPDVPQTAPLTSGNSDRILLGSPIGDRVGDAVNFLSKVNGSTAGGSGGGG